MFFYFFMLKSKNNIKIINYTFLYNLFLYLFLYSYLLFKKLYINI